MKPEQMKKREKRIVMGWIVGLFLASIFMGSVWFLVTALVLTFVVLIGEAGTKMAYEMEKKKEQNMDVSKLPPCPKWECPYQPKGNSEDFGVYDRVVFKRSYCLSVTVDDLLAIMKGDNEEDESLFSIIGKLSGVVNVDYDGHFGPWIYVDIESEHDTQESWEKIDRMVFEYRWKHEDSAKG